MNKYPIGDVASDHKKPIIRNLIRAGEGFGQSGARQFYARRKIRAF